MVLFNCVHNTRKKAIANFRKHQSILSSLELIVQRCNLYGRVISIKSPVRINYEMQIKAQLNLTIRCSCKQTINYNNNKLWEIALNEKQLLHTYIWIKQP